MIHGGYINPEDNRSVQSVLKEKYDKGVESDMCAP